MVSPCPAAAVATPTAANCAARSPKQAARWLAENDPLCRKKPGIPLLLAAAVAQTEAAGVSISTSAALVRVMTTWLARTKSSSRAKFAPRAAWCVGGTGMGGRE
eukprot:scaffold4228_cov135-Isochrysis_galbana.AAC.7